MSLNIRAARSRSESILVTTEHAGKRSRRPDELIVEEPMTVQLDGVTVSTTMRTPGHDFELAVGFCYTEGLLADMPVTGARYCATGSAVGSEFNVVTVETNGRAPTPQPRLGNTTSSCGLCGNDAIDELCDRLAPLPATAPIPFSNPGIVSIPLSFLTLVVVSLLTQKRTVATA